MDDFVAADAVGHRIVHFGGLEIGAAVVDEQVLRGVEEGAEVAPLHNRPALKALERARAALPGVPHVAVSDSAFHRTISEEARRYALPDTLGSIVRLGFHGLAVQSVVEQIEAARVVVCHLGGGCSVTAVRDRRSVDTSMGYTAARGSPDGDTLRLGRSRRRAPPAALRNWDRRARPHTERGVRLRALGGLEDEFALSHFTYHLAKTVAAMAAVLGGVDVLAFSGGIGENRADVREAVAARLRHLGGFRIAVVAAREDLVIAGAVRGTLAAAASAAP